MKNGIYLLLIVLLSNCANYKVQINNTNSKSTFDITNNSAIDHTFYLIGDAGNMALGKDLKHFNLLKKELENSNENATLLFLGDNIYSNGMPKKNNEDRKLAEHRIQVQIDLVKNFKGQAIFIPGNHDYYSNGIKGLKREEDYITKQLGKKAFYPKDGCPIKEIDISEDLMLLIVDSQWYLEDWFDNPTMNDNCDIKTRELFFAEFESVIKKNTDKTIVIATHHPLFSYGPHGGRYSAKKHLHPVKGKVPIPLVGSFMNLLRTTSGVSPQDNNNPIYRELQKRLLTISQKAPKAIFVSGHEHSLQYIFEENKPQIISGSGSKYSETKLKGSAKFTYGGLGYAKYDVFKDKSSKVTYYRENEGVKEVLFETKVFEKEKENKWKEYSNDFPAVVKAKIYSEKEVNKNALHRFFWGKHYRKYYGTNIEAATVNLDTLFGGLKPVRKGGGNQSRSLRLKDKDGKEYVMRALRKSATQYLQAFAFKDTYVKGKFENTVAERVLMDAFTAAHPYAPFAVGELSDAIQLYHTNPKLYYIPKQNALKEFNSNFGDELYMIEERAADKHGDKASFGFSNKLISTKDLFLELRKSEDIEVDEQMYIRARLFDMLIGDWDRHQDQWRWAKFKTGKKIVYRPVPRDRDQAFSKNDGLIFELITRGIPALKLMQKYDDEMRSVKWFNVEPFPLDVAFIQQSNMEVWNNQVAFIQNNLTEDIIEHAFESLPKEVNDETISFIKEKLKGRLKNLNKIAKKYYKLVNKYAVITGDDKNNWFEVSRQPNNKTKVSIYTIKKKVKNRLVFEREFTDKVTKEIWLYGLDDEDVFKVVGDEKTSIRLRLIGGQNKDKYVVENNDKVTVYDFKSKKSKIQGEKVHAKLIDDYEQNTYNYKNIKYNQSQLLPLVGYNPDDGVILGASFHHTVNGFEKNPFTRKHTFDAGYYFATNGFDIKYNVEFANVISNWNLVLDTKFTSPNYSINHFGNGNESVNLTESLDDDNYHRVKLSTIAIKPSLKWEGRMGAEFNVGIGFESIEVENTPSRFINSVYTGIEERNDYAKLKAHYNYTNLNDKTFPTLGMAFDFQFGFTYNLNDNTEKFAFLKPSFGITKNITANEKLVFATKLSGEILFNDNFSFYNAASLGGENGLRGFNKYRFKGQQSFYQSSDIRLDLKRFKTSFIPFRLGVFGGVDYGRVWINNENSNKWHNSFGGGVWLVGAEIVNINLSMFNSTDGNYIKFGLGFGF